MKTTIKMKYRPSSISGRLGTIYFQLIHERKVRQLITNYHIYAEEWNSKTSTIKIVPNSNRESLLLSIRDRIRWDKERLNMIVTHFESSDIQYSVVDIIEQYNIYQNEYSLFNFMESIIAKLKIDGKVRTSETYKAALNSFKKYRDNEDIMLDAITPEIMESYEAWLKNRGISPNSISFYTRILRAAYNRAVDSDIIKNRNPFKHVYTGIDKTIKRAIPLTIIRKIKQLDLSLYPSLDFARDMFLLSFMLRGMSFIDMAYLRKSNLENGYIHYRRRKTGQLLIIEWTKEMQFILDKYPKNDSEYLLPIIKSNQINPLYAYRNMSYKVNYNLKKISSIVGLNYSLTLYVARHSWASAAKAKGIPIGVISEGMGHDSEQTTQIYLASLESSIIDRANAKIINGIK